MLLLHALLYASSLSKSVVEAAFCAKTCHVWSTITPGMLQNLPNYFHPHCSFHMMPLIRSIYSIRLSYQSSKLTIPAAMGNSYNMKIGTFLHTQNPRTTWLSQAFAWFIKIFVAVGEVSQLDAGIRSRIGKFFVAHKLQVATNWCFWCKKPFLPTLVLRCFARLLLKPNYTSKL